MSQVSQARAAGAVAWRGRNRETVYIPVDVAPIVAVAPGVEAAPGVEVASEPLAVETGVALSSFTLASSVLNSAAYVEGIAEENHGGRDVSSRAAKTRLVASPVMEATEAAEAADAAISLNTAGGTYDDTRD